MSAKGVRVYTRDGDDGTTGLIGTGRVRKDDVTIELLGAIDEAQAVLGLARSGASGELNELLAGLERDLWLVMARCARPVGEDRGEVTDEMVARLEGLVDATTGALELEPVFSVPGGDELSARLDHARTVVRRAERLLVSAGLAGSAAGRYLNRLSDLCWALARREEAVHLVVSRRKERAVGKDKERTEP